MTLTKAIPILNAAPVPLDGRRADMATVVANADGSPRTGVLGSNASIVTTTATLNLAVAAAEFVTSKGKADGVSIFTNDGTVNVPVGAAPASNSRIDVLWVKQNDNTTGDADSLPTFGVTAGTAAASPSKPAIPTGALELATLRIYSGTTATNGGSNVLTNTYQMTAMRGGVVLFRTKVDLDLWTTAPSGQQAYCEDSNGLYERVDGTWQPVLIPSVSWTPVWENVIIGAGTNFGEYQHEGGRCRGEAKFKLGAGYALNANPVRLTPPVTPRATVQDNVPVGTVVILDNGTGWINGLLMMTSAGMLEIRANGSPYSGPMNGTGSPIAFGVDDQVAVYFDYRA